MNPRDVTDLLERALRAEIRLEDLDDLWPGQPADPHLAEIRHDLAFALEHVPVEDPNAGSELDAGKSCPRPRHPNAYQPPAALCEGRLICFERRIATRIAPRRSRHELLQHKRRRDYRQEDR